MSTIQVGNVVFESTGNNFLQYTTNALAVTVGGANVLGVNSTSVKVSNSTTNVIIGPATIDVGANVDITTTGLSVGNSTVNAAVNSTAFTLNGIAIGLGSSNVQLFTSSGTWTKPDSGSFAIIEAWGGGGGGGSFGGGGGGGYNARTMLLSDLTSTVTVTIGAGGANTGGTGGTTTFGSHLSAYGGLGGQNDGSGTGIGGGGGGPMGPGVKVGTGTAAYCRGGDPYYGANASGPGSGPRSANGYGGIFHGGGGGGGNGSAGGDSLYGGGGGGSNSTNFGVSLFGGNGSGTGIGSQPGGGGAYTGSAFAGADGQVKVTVF